MLLFWGYPSCVAAQEFSSGSTEPNPDAHINTELLNELLILIKTREEQLRFVDLTWVKKKQAHLDEHRKFHQDREQTHKNLIEYARSQGISVPPEQWERATDDDIINVWYSKERQAFDARGNLIGDIYCENYVESDQEPSTWKIRKIWNGEYWESYFREQESPDHPDVILGHQSRPTRLVVLGTLAPNLFSNSVQLANGNAYDHLTGTGSLPQTEGWSDILTEAKNQNRIVSCSPPENNPDSKQVMIDFWISVEPYIYRTQATFSLTEGGRPVRVIDASSANKIDSIERVVAEANSVYKFEWLKAKLVSESLWVPFLLHEETTRNEPVWLTKGDAPFKKNPESTGDQDLSVISIDWSQTPKRSYLMGSAETRLKHFEQLSPERDLLAEPILYPAGTRVQDSRQRPMAYYELSEETEATNRANTKALPLHMTTRIPSVIRTDLNQFDYIPYVIVGIFAVVAIVLVIVFGHRS
ncbi:hypothetical protein [Polystyrenella longa]|nr:hypothetical protein [Polystyrenella longa]